MIYLLVLFGAFVVFIIFILPIIQVSTDFTKSTIHQRKEKSEKEKLARTINNDANQRKNEYLNKTESFKYSSNEYLTNLYKSNNYLNPLEQLALEEALVNRKIIKSSHTHEKMQRMEFHFENKIEKQYQRTSKNELNQYASALSFIIKNRNSSQKDKIAKMIYELSENIFYSSFRDIDKIPVDLQTIIYSDNLKNDSPLKNYYLSWKSIKNSINNLATKQPIDIDKYDLNECLPIIKNLITSASREIKRLKD